MKFLNTLALIFASSYALAANPVKTIITKNESTAHIKIEADVSAQNPALDILFVVDNSGSMDPYQKNLSNHIESLINQFKASDVHAGVITTDTISGNLIAPYLSNTNFDFTEKLKQQILSVGTSGNSIEMFFTPILATLEQNKSAGFIRENASLAIIIISDAEDQSEMISEEFISQLLTYKAKEKIVFSAVYVERAAPGCYANSSGVTPKLETVLGILNSTRMSICLADYKTALENMAQEIIAKAGLSALNNRQFKLPLAPILNSVNVTYGSTVLQRGDFLQGWYYDSKKQTLNIGSDFNYANEPQGTKLVIDYLVNYSSNITQ
jgi:von Willebrand factor type A domain